MTHRIMSSSSTTSQWERGNFLMRKLQGLPRAYLTITVCDKAQPFFLLRLELVLVTQCTGILVSCFSVQRREGYTAFMLQSFSTYVLICMAVPLHAKELPFHSKEYIINITCIQSPITLRIIVHCVRT